MNGCLKNRTVKWLLKKHLFTKIKFKIQWEAKNGVEYY